MFGLSIAGIAYGSIAALIVGLYAYAKYKSYKYEKASDERFAEKIRAMQAEHRLAKRTELDAELDAQHESARLTRRAQYEKYQKNTSARDDLDNSGLFDGTANQVCIDTPPDSGVSG